MLQVLARRFVDPPCRAFLAGRQLQAWGAGDRDFRVAYDWRDMDEIAPRLPLSMIAAEDQDFARHGGFDFEAIEKARASNARGGRMRGASTISPPVPNNLFLWTGDSRSSRWVRQGDRTRGREGSGGACRVDLGCRRVFKK